MCDEYIGEYIEAVVGRELGGDASRFDELWNLVPNLGKQLRTFNSDSSWLHWTPKTYDGWYCVEMPSGFDVYFQERGSIGERRHFDTEMAAVSFAISVAVFPITG